MADLRLLEVDLSQARANAFVERVMDEDHAACDGRRCKQILEVLTNAVDAVVAVDECEVDVHATVCELGEHLWEQHVAVAFVEDDVRESFLRHARIECQVERVNDFAVGADRGKTSAAEGADLERDPRIHGREHSLHRRAFTKRHAPVVAAEELLQRVPVCRGHTGESSEVPGHTASSAAV